MSNKITKDMIISDVLRMNRGAAQVFMKYGMHCIGCPVASGESIEQASAAHNIDAVKLVEDLNKYLDESVK